MDGVDAGRDGLERVGRSKHPRIDLIHHHVRNLWNDKLIGHRHSMVVTVGLACRGQHQQHHYKSQKQFSLHHIIIL